MAAIVAPGPSAGAPGGLLALFGILWGASRRRSRTPPGQPRALDA
jgi:MYXO-CTERM domain-containing protein